MRRLEELLQQYCPNGVEYKTVKEVYMRLRGTPITARKMKEIENPDGDIRIFAGGKTVINAFEEDIPNANVTRVPAVLVQSRGVIDFVYYDKPFTFKNEMWAYTCDEQVSLRYLWHVLKNNILHFRKAAEGMGSLPQISLPVTEDFVLPVPPFPVQQEIVRILDSFTELEAELEAELLLRKKQYEYYRDEILDCSDADSIPLIELFNTRNGFTPSKNNAAFWKDGVLPWFRMDDIRANGRILSDAMQHVTLKAAKNKPFPANSIIVSTTATIGEHALITVEFLSNQQFTCLTLKDEYKDKYDMKFLFYYCFKLDAYCLQNLNHGNFASVDMTKFGKFKFPVISLQEQERIVSILDRFDALCTDISSGIPAEIVARRKQYEYYRDKLLSFETITT